LLRKTLKRALTPDQVQAVLAVERRVRIVTKYLKSLRNLPRSNKFVFDRIYTGNRWGNHESVSGYGSTLSETQLLRSLLATLIHELNVRSLLDVPCGDFNWMRLVDIGDAEYVGVDVVSELIAGNNERFATTTRRFVCADAESETLPRADLVLCRDLMVHLPNRSALRLIRNLKKTGSRYLLATTFPRTGQNEAIIRGMWRPINLERPPFSLPRPLRVLSDETSGVGGEDKSLGLWCLQDISFDEGSE
jgi:SAM-dependent methyltransferase